MPIYDPDSRRPQKIGGITLWVAARLSSLGKSQVVVGPFPSREAAVVWAAAYGGPGEWYTGVLLDPDPEEGIP